MAQIALPRQQVSQPQSSLDMGTPLYQRRAPSHSGSIELIPNPHFVFPQQPDSPPPTSRMPHSPGTRPTSLQVPANARRTPAGAKRRSASALPDFSFNPADQPPPALTTTTPPLTPTSTAPNTPSRNIGHRRGASEFIGNGGARDGSTVLLSSSPTKGEGAMLAPSTTTLRPGPAGRRGHAHRRSGAISSHDLSSIMNPKASTAPIPAIPGPPLPPLPTLQDFSSPSSGNTPSQLSPPATSSEDAGYFPNSSTNSSTESSPGRPGSRARVGFADKVEYIRPLSTISSETESTMSTIRGHSVSNSLSSVMSGNATNPTSRPKIPGFNLALDNENAPARRPSTAGAVLDVMDSGKITFAPAPQRPKSAFLPEMQYSPTSSSSSSTPQKKRGFPFYGRHGSVSEPALGSPSEPLPSPAETASMEEAGHSSVAPSTPPRKSKSLRRPRKVKSWATAIISRKSKAQKAEEIPRRGSTPTLPTEVGSPADFGIDLDDLEPNFDVDDTVTIVEPLMNPMPRPTLNTDFASWEPKPLTRQNSDLKSPVIDLDAALGPFNTPTIGPVPRQQRRGFSAARQKMHSSSGLPIHRRTESAPELVPFELLTSQAPPRPAMADVFEEEEEEAEAAGTPGSEKADPVRAASGPGSVIEEKEEDEDEVGTGIQVVEADQPQKGAALNWNFDDAFRSSRTSREPSPVEIVEDHEEPRTASLTRSSDDTITPTNTTEAKVAQQMMHLSLPAARRVPMTPDTLNGSAFSTPEFSHGEGNFEPARLGTATSARTLSTGYGEPGPDYRGSSDDVPSLTSSRSTMTTAAQGGFPFAVPRSPGDRNSSVSSVPSNASAFSEQRRRKRSSIVSLSRLVGMSNGERSKLSIEQRPQTQHGGDQPRDSLKGKKSRRVSKMLQFWKRQDNSS
ncbi:hypothetical protein K490DRAFT_42066 [Saccharata proteae CBS 121410]|uniref:Cell wall proline rich protein n=1 Tax=Saccharata proteae CBS 121410 TaxID=1314787 RepID=A0A9P4HVA3_9PEZI|nr:hypothetical protein K490DRAFT_42066 [Saccharata proteae CBS 121410]